MGFIIYYLVLIVNPMGRILVRWNFFRNNIEMLCHPICNWMYICIFKHMDIRISIPTSVIFRELQMFISVCLYSNIDLDICTSVYLDIWGGFD